MIRTFAGAGETVSSRTHLLAMVNRLRGRSGRTILVARVARYLHPRGRVTAAEVVTVAQANPTLFTLSNGNANITLTGAGLRAARSRMSPRYAIK